MKNFLFFLITVSLFLISCGKDGDCDECEIQDIEVKVGECNCEDAFEMTLDFTLKHTTSEYFTLTTRNNIEIGIYKLSQLPITIPKYELSGLDEEYIKICVEGEESECCEEFEFEAPNCAEEQECEVFDLEVTVGECSDEGGYDLTIGFEYGNPGNDYFDLYVRNGVLLNTFKLSELPITILNFIPSGADEDYFKVCINDIEGCCKEIEWRPAECEEAECKIFDLEVETGECISEKKYQLFLNFEYQNPTHSNFEVFVRDGVRIGNYPLNALPLKIEEFETSGKDYDYIKVCMSDDLDCCKEIEILAPNCEEEGECKITEMEVTVGDCNSDGTYKLTLDFEYKVPSHEYFDLFVRDGVHIGYYKLSDLPLTLPEFEKSGKEYDFLKVCINDNPDCCKESEFKSPNC